MLFDIFGIRGRMRRLFLIMCCSLLMLLAACGGSTTTTSTTPVGSRPTPQSTQPTPEPTLSPTVFPDPTPMNESDAKTHGMPSSHLCVTSYTYITTTITLGGTTQHGVWKYNATCSKRTYALYYWTDEGGDRHFVIQRNTYYIILSAAAFSDSLGLIQLATYGSDESGSGKFAIVVVLFHQWNQFGVYEISGNSADTIQLDQIGNHLLVFLLGAFVGDNDS